MNAGTCPIAKLGSTPNPLGRDVSSVKQIVGQNITKLLEGRPDLNQAKLAHECGKTKGAVTHWVSGKSLPEAEALEVIAELFNCRVYQLFIPWDEWGGPKSPQISPDAALRIYLKSIGYSVVKAKREH